MGRGNASRSTRPNAHARQNVRIGPSTLSAVPGSLIARAVDEPEAEKAPERSFNEKWLADAVRLRGTMAPQLSFPGAFSVMDFAELRHYEGPIAILDLETNGFLDDPTTRPIEFGVLRVPNRRALAKLLGASEIPDDLGGKSGAWSNAAGWVADQAYVHVDRPLPPKIVKITHITDEDLAREGVDPAEAYDRLRRATEGALIIAYNADFDLGHLARWGGDFGRPEWPGTALCALRAARATIPGMYDRRTPETRQTDVKPMDGQPKPPAGSYKLMSLAEYLNAAPDVSHRALADVVTTGAVLAKLLERPAITQEVERSYLWAYDWLQKWRDGLVRREGGDIPFGLMTNEKLDRMARELASELLQQDPDEHARAVGIKVWKWATEIYKTSWKVGAHEVAIPDSTVPQIVHHVNLERRTCDCSDSRQGPCQHLAAAHFATGKLGAFDYLLSHSGLKLRA